MYDVLIVGGGPAGLTAAIYARRALLGTLVVEKQGAGGQIALTDKIENYPGIKSITGLELMDLFREQAAGLGTEFAYSEIQNIEPENGHFSSIGLDGKTLAKSIIIATGAHPRRLKIPGEKELTGKGVSFCATCDGPFFKDQTVAVIGGGNSAIHEALFLSGIAKKVFLIHRRDSLRAEKILQEKVFSRKNIQPVWDTVVERINGSEFVESVSTKNLINSETGELPVQGVFIFVGTRPSTEFIDVKKDDLGFIVTDEEMNTSIKGIFAAGDCRSKKLRQVVTAVGDGATAAISAKDYIESFK